MIITSRGLPRAEPRVGGGRLGGRPLRRVLGRAEGACKVSRAPKRETAEGDPDHT